MWEAHNDPRNYSADVITLLHVPAGQPHVVETIIQLPALRNITIPRASAPPALCFSFDQGHRNRSIAFVASDGSVYKRASGLKNTGEEEEWRGEERERA